MVGLIDMMKISYMFAYGFMVCLAGLIVTGYDFYFTGTRNYTTWTYFTGLPLIVLGGAIILISLCVDQRKLRFID